MPKPYEITDGDLANRKRTPQSFKLETALAKLKPGQKFYVENEDYKNMESLKNAVHMYAKRVGIRVETRREGVGIYVGRLE